MEQMSKQIYTYMETCQNVMLAQNTNNIYIYWQKFPVRIEIVESLLDDMS